MSVTICCRTSIRATLIGKGTVGLLNATGTYDVDRYPWAYEFWKRQQQTHWMGEEVPLGADIKDWSLGPRHRRRARAADPDLPLLHAVGRRSRRQLPQALHPDLPAAGSADDDGRLHQYGDGAYRRLCAAAEDAGHAADRVRGVPRLCARCAPRPITCTPSASRPAPTWRAPWPCSAPSPRACRCSPASRCC